MPAKYILAALAVAFFFAGLIRRRRPDPGAAIQSRTWLLVAAIFAAVSAWLFVGT